MQMQIHYKGLYKRQKVKSKKPPKCKTFNFRLILLLTSPGFSAASWHVAAVPAGPAGYSPALAV